MPKTGRITPIILLQSNQTIGCSAEDLFSLAPTAYLYIEVCIMALTMSQ